MVNLQFVFIILLQFSYNNSILCTNELRIVRRFACQTINAFIRIYHILATLYSSSIKTIIRIVANKQSQLHFILDHNRIF